jgi:hypothetical protein
LGAALSAWRGQGRARPDITTEKQALEYARALLAQARRSGRPQARKTVRFVVIPMVRDHLQVRAVKFKPLVRQPRAASACPAC